MITLTREKGNRMWGGGGASAAGGGGGDMSGFASQGWVDENYLSKSFFSTLFIIHATQTVTVTDNQGQPVGEPVVTEITLAPNQLPGTTSVTDEQGNTTTTVIALESIEATTNFYSDGGVSALGQSSGGGGGGASALTDLVDVAISSPTNGQVLMYNSSTGKWYNGTVQSGGVGTVTSITAGTGLTGGTITSSGTIALSQEAQAAIANGMTAYGWGDHSQAGYLKQTDISDMATKTWVGQQGFLKASDLNGYATQQWVGQNYLGKNDTAAAATKLQTASTLWGNSFDGTADIGTQNSNASLNYVADINMSGNLTCQNVFADTEIRFHESGNWWWTLGYEAGSSNSSFNLVRYNNSTYVTTVLLSADTNGGISVNSGQLWVKQSAQGIRIGDGVIQWDSTNNALKVINADGTAANLYTTGGVSALGMSAGVSQVDAMTFNHLSVKNSMTLNGSVNIIMGSSSQIVRQENDSDCLSLLNDYTNSKINIQKYYYNQYDNVGLLGKDYNYSDTTWWIDPDGCALFQRVYLSNNVYLYTDGSNIKVRIGSTVYTLTKS